MPTTPPAQEKPLPPQDPDKPAKTTTPTDNDKRRGRGVDDPTRS